MPCEHIGKLLVAHSGNLSRPHPKDSVLLRATDTAELATVIALCGKVLDNVVVTENGVSAESVVLFHILFLFWFGVTKVGKKIGLSKYFSKKMQINFFKNLTAEETQPRRRIQQYIV